MDSFLIYSTEPVNAVCMLWNYGLFIIWKCSWRVACTRPRKTSQPTKTRHARLC